LYTALSELWRNTSSVYGDYSSNNNTNALWRVSGLNDSNTIPDVYILYTLAISYALYTLYYATTCIEEKCELIIFVGYFVVICANVALYSFLYHTQRTSISTIIQAFRSGDPAAEPRGIWGLNYSLVEYYLELAK